MKHLSGLDATFLHLETAEMPMHVGALHLLELPKHLQGGYLDVIKRHVAARMHLAPVLTKKLALMPFELSNPVWVDAETVDLDYHIRQVTLPKPGTQAQLEAQVGRLHSILLERGRPLWEFYVFKGLKSGQLAFYTKIHHAALDGQGAMVLASALLDASALPRVVEPARLHAKAPGQPPVSSMLKAALRDTVSQCARLVRAVPGGLKVAAGLLAPAPGQDGQGRITLPKLSLAPRTPLNVSITNERVFATASVSVKEALAIGKTFGGTLNDAVMGIVAGALRRYLDQHGALPERALVAAVPVSLRAEGNLEMNNQVSMMVMQLATDEADPAARMKAIVKASAKMKRTASNAKSLMPTDFPSLGLPWLMSSLAALVGRARLADTLPPLANVVISNVPGPPMALYLAGARMSTNYPASIVVHGVALNVTVQSYNGALDFGMLACRRAMPDIALFAAQMLASHQELLAAAVALQAKVQVQQEPAPTNPVKKRAAPRKRANQPALPAGSAAKPAPQRKPRAAASA